jgi:hypothetical protein
VTRVQHDEIEGDCLGTALYCAQPVGRQNSSPTDHFRIGRLARVVVYVKPSKEMTMSYDHTNF